MKIFVGNVDGADTTPEELVALFSRYGTVTNCAVLKQYAFVHMPEKACMLRAIEALHGHELRPGRALVVKMSRPRPLHTCKIFVGNVSAACTSQELRSLFEGCGRVVECEVVKDYAFIHMEKEADAKAAIAQLNGKEVKGRRLNVELSTKGQKTGPGLAIQSGDKTKKPGAGDAAFPGTGGFSATFDYQQAFGNNTGGFDGQARQPTPPFFGRDRSPLRRSPPGAVYGAQAPSSYGVHAAAASYNAQGAVSSLGSYGAQAASYGAQPMASSLVYGAQAASYSAQPSASYNAQSAPYPAQQAVSYSSQPAAYVAQPAAAYAGQPAAYVAETSTPKAACYGSQPIVQTQLNSYGAQASVGLSGCYGAQSAAAATGSYGAAYGAQPFASLSAPYCTPFASLAASYAAQQHPQAPVSYHGQPGNAYDGAGQPSVAYRSMPQGAIANPNSTPPPYERTRLSPPRASYEDHYKTAVAMSKRYGSDRAL